MCYVPNRGNHCRFYRTVSQHAGTHITHRLSPPRADSGRSGAQPAARGNGNHHCRTSRNALDRHTGTNHPRLHVADRIGTEWILPQPDPWMSHVGQLAARLRMTVFLSHPEQDRRSKKHYNSVFVIAPDGTIAGTHRKINTLRIGSESWSSPGKDAVPVPVHPVGHVGILICADAFSPRIAGHLKAQGARMLVSSAAWAPGLHGPNGDGSDARKIPDSRSWCAIAPDPTGRSTLRGRRAWSSKMGSASCRCHRNALPYLSSTGIPRRTTWRRGNTGESTYEIADSLRNVRVIAR